MSDHQHAWSKPNMSGNAHYKATRTVTGPDGKTHTETIEVSGDDAVNLMRGLRSNYNDIPDFDGFGFSSITNPNKFSDSGPRIQRNSRSPRSNPHASSLSPAHTAMPQHTNISQSNEEFFKDALNTHNELRRRHQVGPLRLNNDLTKLAQAWADHLAATGSFAHSDTKYRNTKVGENLRSQSWPVTGKVMTESWYNECAKYDYGNPSYQPGTGHFTQVVWKGSEEVGFGRAQGASMNFAVAMYYPPGNNIAEFARNVFPPK